MVPLVTLPGTLAHEDGSATWADISVELRTASAGPGSHYLSSRCTNLYTLMTRSETQGDRTPLEP
jgi:hypothetical protein